MLLLMISHFVLSHVTFVITKKQAPQIKKKVLPKKNSQGGKRRQNNTFMTFIHTNSLHSIFTIYKRDKNEKQLIELTFQDTQKEYENPDY